MGPMHDLAFPRTVDPFSAVSIKFSGMSGEGKAELQISDQSAAEYADIDQFKVTPCTGLSNGDTVTVKAIAPAGWHFEPSEKQFTVKRLTTWVSSTSQLSGDNLKAIHSNTERLIREADKEFVLYVVFEDGTDLTEELGALAMYDKISMQDRKSVV